MINWSEGKHTHTLKVSTTNSSELAIGKPVVIECGPCLRWLPERRGVYDSVITGTGQRVVAKAFLPGARQERDWRREWEGLLQLKARELQAPEAICVATDEVSGVVWVLMVFVENAQTIEAALDACSIDDVREITQKLVGSLFQMHEAGVQQTDQHIANWAYDGSQIYLLDAATIKFQEGALNAKARLEDVSALCVTLPVAAESAFVTAFSKHYGGSAVTGEILDKLNAQMCDYQISRLHRYQKKTLRECTEFSVHEAATTKGLFSKAADSALVSAFFADPESLMVSGERLKSGNTCTVQGFDWADSGYVLKRYNVKPMLYRLRHAFSNSRALLSWSAGWVLRLAFIPTAKPVAVIDTCGNGCRYILTERIEGTLLPEYVKGIENDPDAIMRLCQQFSVVFDRLERMRGVHGDFKATNWIVGNDGVLRLFDLDAFCFGLSAETYNRGHQKDMDRLLANWETDSPIRVALSKMQIAS